MADRTDNDWSGRASGRAPAIPAAEVGAVAIALVLLGFGFAALFGATKAHVHDGVVLVTLLLLPAIVYFTVSGKVSQLKGPGGVELSIARAANTKLFEREVLANLVVLGQDQNQAVSYQQIRAGESHDSEVFARKVYSLIPSDPVVFTLTLGGGPIDAMTVANYVKALTQFPRFRFVAIVDSKDRLVSYMHAGAFAAVIEADVIDAQVLLSNIERQEIGQVRAHPGMIQTTVTPGTGIADALREMNRVQSDALLVAQDGYTKGIAERDRLVSALMLLLLEQATG